MQGILKRCVAFALLAALSIAVAGEDEIDARIRKEDRPVAPSLEGTSAWINVEKPLTMADLKGKIVLMDFWTFG
jgi:hypothetical protein